MAKKSRYIPKPSEHKGGKIVSCNLYLSMLTDPKYLELSPGAKVLYQYMKLQQFGAKPIDNMPTDYFYFNKAMYLKGNGNPHSYQLYSNSAQFRQYRDELIKSGFIEFAYKDHIPGTKDIFKLSTNWYK